MKNEYPENRLFSLDALRGLDMILLTVVGPLVCAAQAGWGCFPPGFMRQFHHGWECFTLWDIIMPLFIFMCGAAMPFALGGRLKQGQGVFWRHVLARVALLWFLGGLVQGHWHTLDPVRMSPFSNTLQSIAIGYLAVAAVIATGSKVFSVAVPIALAVVYTLLLAFFGDYSEFGNFAFRVDQAIFRAVLPASSRWIAKPSFYTWFLTSAMFAAMTFAGYHATMLLRSPRSAWAKAAALGAYGAALLVVGFVSEIRVPCIKPIFTLTFTAQAMGWCVLSLAALYVVTDIWKFRWGAAPLLLFGQMALTCYFISHFFKPVLEALVHLVGDGFLSYIPKTAHPFLVCLLMVAATVLAMLAWRRLKGRG